MELQNWYGVVSKVKFKSNGVMSDPTLIFEGMEFNYWDIAEPVYSMYGDDIGDTPPNESDFMDWLKSNTEMIYQYLWDCVSGGYFGSEDE